MKGGGVWGTDYEITDEIFPKVKGLIQKQSFTVKRYK